MTPCWCWQLARLACAENVQEALAAEQGELAAQTRPQQVQPLVSVFTLRLRKQSGPLRSPPSLASDAPHWDAHGIFTSVQN